MIGWLIIACEIGFWVFVLAGLAARYLLRMKKTGAVLLLCTPVIDLILLGATIIDLQSGKDAEFVHAVAAIYIGSTIAFGHKMIHWADIRFAHRYAGGPAPEKPHKLGKSHAKRERAGWYRHFLAWAIGCALLFGMIALIGDSSRTAELQTAVNYWSLILAADFLYSFSYTLWPRKGRESEI
ncbi:hypothetical protein CEF21_10400 [Bacillus sp. FJAT-42376]|uniref:hypothetical protein n=1 Tax=Bacillus sp. FJAT-42376 TaxID=2014076 RepID=UPI000F512A90|nr:hypothetical protein [Bacillus sp. FJAT-42376]AZB42667.1 hypothetical protein CEF21_10400 [Bacillus sp. FJAT-42376]